MGKMKNIYANLIERVSKETGYDPGYITIKFNEALEEGVKPIDFFDDIVDGFCFGEEGG